MPIHIHPTAELAARVLLPGDPGRALLLSQTLLDTRKMFNHNRGLWGYSGTALDGAPLTIQSTGIGGPSAAIVVSELIDLGAQTLLRAGTCGALTPEASLGELLIVEQAICGDGTSSALAGAERVAADAAGGERVEAGGERVEADVELVARLAAAAEAEGGARTGTVVSTDLFYDPREPEQGWRERGALAVEMEAATVLALAASRGVRAGALLIVSDLLAGGRTRIEPAALREAELRMGRVALGALGALG